MGLLEKIKKPKASFWPWTKKKTVEQKIEDYMALVTKYLPTIKAMMRGGPDGQITDGKYVGQMYDFYQDFSGGFMNGSMAVTPMEFDSGDVAANGITLGGISIETEPSDKRQDKKPVEVVGELETVPTPFTLDGLDEKIALFTDKSRISNQRYAKDQIDGFKKRLENRKQYRENIEFYSQFPNTTDDKIDNLLAKYKLEMNSSELFVPTFPKEAIDVMKKYSEVTEQITGEKPVFYVIAEEKDFRKKRGKLDPILLAQSPFGFYWQILGAWDAEMLLLSEL